MKYQRGIIAVRKTHQTTAMVTQLFSSRPSGFHQTRGGAIMAAMLLPCLVEDRPAHEVEQAPGVVDHQAQHQREEDPQEDVVEDRLTKRYPDALSRIAVR